MLRSTIAGIGAVAVAAILGAGQPVLADVGAKDIQVAAKTFGFTAPPLSGTIKVAVIFDAGVAASQAEADQMKSILGAGLAVGASTLVPVLVPVGQLDAGLDGASVAFVTGGLAAHQDAIVATTKAKKLLSVSTDTACVQNGRCVMGVKSDPKVEILVNKAVAEASAVSFAPAFRMMITEL